MFGIIYKVTNIINNKKYIGQTTKSLNERKKNKLWLITELYKENIHIKEIFYAFYKKHKIFIIKKVETIN